MDVVLETHRGTGDRPPRTVAYPTRDGTTGLQGQRHRGARYMNTLCQCEETISLDPHIHLRVLLLPEMNCRVLLR